MPMPFVTKIKGGLALVYGDGEAYIGFILLQVAVFNGVGKQVIKDNRTSL